MSPAMQNLLLITEVVKHSGVSRAHLERSRRALTGSPSKREPRAAAPARHIWLFVTLLGGAGGQESTVASHHTLAGLFGPIGRNSCACACASAQVLVERQQEVEAGVW
jgi:hypothetical protein